MKSFALALGAAVTLVVAQDTSGLPECGVECANTMLTGQTAGIDCGERDLQCLCQDRNFIYGLRDCSAATCSGDEARQIVEFGIEACRDAGIVITTGAGGEPTPTTVDESGSASVSTIFTTISSDGEVITTPVSTTTIVGGGGDDDETLTDSNGTPTATPDSSNTSDVSEVVSTVTTDGTTVVTTLSTVTSGSDEATDTSTDGGEETTDGGAATSTEDEGAAVPQRTMVPAGILAAGVAALLL